MSSWWERAKLLCYNYELPLLRPVPMEQTNDNDTFYFLSGRDLSSLRLDSQVMNKVNGDLPECPEAAERKSISPNNISPVGATPPKSSEVTQVLEKLNERISREPTPEESTWSGMSSDLSLSCLMMANDNFSTSSPIFTRRSAWQKRKYPVEDTVIAGMSPDGTPTSLMLSTNNDTFCDLNVPEVEMEGEPIIINWDNDKCESQAISVVDVRKAIIALSNGKPAGNAPGMISGAARMEACQELLRHVATKLKHANRRQETVGEVPLEEMSGRTLDSLDEDDNVIREAVPQTPIRQSVYEDNSPPKVELPHAIWDITGHELSSCIYSSSGDNATTAGGRKQLPVPDPFEGFDQPFQNLIQLGA